MASYAPARIHIRDAAATDASIVVDGQDLANVTRAFTLRSRVGDIPVLTVELQLVAGAELDAAGVVVSLGPETRAALIALGWTPPDDAASSIEHEPQLTLRTAPTAEHPDGVSWSYDPAGDTWAFARKPAPDIEPDPSTGAQR